MSGATKASAVAAAAAAMAAELALEEVLVEVEPLLLLLLPPPRSAARPAAAEPQFPLTLQVRVEALHVRSAGRGKGGRRCSVSAKKVSL